MASQRERTGMETFVSLLKFWAAMIYLPICLFLPSSTRFLQKMVMGK